jgi:NAD(P)-dependent dehydrogenase (short-subunit alcohol dehydrogenase family)
MNNQKVWFITGASKGLGLSLVNQLLAQGFKVAATSRKLADLTAAVPASADFLPLTMDLTSDSNVGEAIAQTVKHFGHIDVVVNNAGYGLLGSLEELSDVEVKDNFTVNVFGSLNVIRHAMPYLRAQGSGHIFNISSIGGYSSAFPGWGIYCATKFAVQGFTGSLAAESKALGINVTGIYPGYFRTEFLTAGSFAVAKQPIDDYQAVRDSQEAHQNEINGNQPGDPEKAVAAIIKIAAEPNPPVHLFLGQDAYDMANQQMESIKQELETWKELTTTTGF